MEGDDRWQRFQHISQLINEDDCLEFSLGRLLLPPLLLLFAIKIQILVHPQWQLQVRDTLVHCNKHLGVCAVITLTCFCQRAIVQSVLAFGLASLGCMPHAPHCMPHAPYLSSNALKSASIGFVLRSAFCRRFFVVLFYCLFQLVASVTCHFFFHFRYAESLRCTVLFPPLPPFHHSPFAQPFQQAAQFQTDNDNVEQIMTRNLLELWVHILMEFRLIYTDRGCGLASFSRSLSLCAQRAPCCWRFLFVFCSVLRFVPLTR